MIELDSIKFDTLYINDKDIKYINIDNQKYDIRCLKAFDIIKKKKVDIEFLFSLWENGRYDDEHVFENYNRHCGAYQPKRKLTLKEYELLKGVLRNNESR